MDLDERKRKILSAIVSAYIETGEPVGSKTLIDRENLTVSSATVRNEMSELERLGYLKKTHTSSGRVPSNLGYRYYVNTLQPYALTETERSDLGEGFETCAGLNDLLELATRHLAHFSGCTVFGVSPHSPDGTCRFEVVPAGRKTMAVMVITGGTVKSYFCRSEHEITSRDAERLSEILNSLLAGIPSEQIGNLRLILLERAVRDACPDHLCIVPTVKKILGEAKDFDLHIGGTENLLNYPEFADIDTARDFVGMLASRKDILSALLAARPTDPIEIRIGADNGLFQSPHASLITLFSNEKFPVLLGLMGPIRMNYARTIAGCNHFLLRLNDYLGREY